jgi:hypothetical protein
VEFQTTPPNPASVSLEELLHVVPMNGQSPLVSKRPARRANTSGKEQTTSSNSESSP